MPVLRCVSVPWKKKQETDDGQPVVGAFRPQDLALLLLQRRHATDRLAPAAQLRHHSAGQITGKEMHEEKKFCFFCFSPISNSTGFYNTQNRWV